MWMRAVVLGACGVIASTSAWAGVPQHILWAAAEASSETTSNLYVLDDSDGSTLATVGPIGFAVTGLAVDPTDGTLYGATSGNSAASPWSLITINRTTGQGTVLAAFNPVMRIGDITFDPLGQMFGYAYLNEAGDEVAQLFRIDKATAALTAVGSSITDQALGAGIAFCGENLYLAVEGGPGRLMVADTTTGATTVIGDADNAPLPDRAFSALACRADGALFAANHSKGPDASTLVRFDRFDGDVEQNGNDPSLTHLDALAFDGVWHLGARAVPSAAVVGQTVTFTGIRGSGQVTVEWDFGDGATGTGLGATHAYAAPGTYDATFTAHASGPTRVTGSLQVHVVAPAPVGRRQSLWGVDGAGASCSSDQGWGCGADAWLYRIDTANGAATPVGPTGYSLSSIAVDPTNGTLFGVTGFQSPRGRTPTLVRLNKQTGAATVIARLTPSGPPDHVYNAIPDMAFDPSGQLWAWNEDSDDLYRLDKTTGVLTLVGDSMDGSAGSGITFSIGGTLFAVLDDLTGPLATINLATGLSTQGPVLSNPPTPNDDEVPALATNDAGVIHGVSYDESEDGERPTFLFTIDTTTAAITTIGRTLSFLDAMEFEPIVAPTIDGTPTVAPQPALAGETVTFTASATGFGGLPLGFSWNFGDGMTGTGSPATHAYAAPGTYNATLTIDDGQSEPVEQAFAVTIAEDLGLKRALIRLNFVKPNKDQIRLRGKLSAPAGFAPANAAVTVDIGGVTTNATLDGKGRATGLAVKANGKFKVALVKGSFAAALADEGLADETVKGKAVTVPMRLQVGANAFGVLRDLQYSAKTGKSGKAK